MTNSVLPVLAYNTDKRIDKFPLTSNDIIPLFCKLNPNKAFVTAKSGKHRANQKKKSLQYLEWLDRSDKKLPKNQIPSKMAISTSIGLITS